MSYRKRLREVRGKRSQENFGLQYGFKPTTYAKIELQSSKFINPNFLISLINNEKININWLLTGEGHKYIQNSDEFIVRENGAPYEHQKIPLVGNINSPQCIVHFFPKSQKQNIEILENFTVVHLDKVSENIELFEITGNHLIPKFHDHDLIMIDKSIKITQIQKNAYGIFSVQANTWIFRRFNDHQSICLLEPLNPDLNTIPIDSGALKIYGIAIHLFRNLH